MGSYRICLSLFVVMSCPCLGPFYVDHTSLSLPNASEITTRTFSRDDANI